MGFPWDLLDEINIAAKKRMVGMKFPFGDKLGPFSGAFAVSFGENDLGWDISSWPIIKVLARITNKKGRSGNNGPCCMIQ